MAKRKAAEAAVAAEKPEKKQAKCAGGAKAKAAAPAPPPAAAAAAAAKPAKAAPAGPAYKNKEKVLVVSSRGITFRFRHLLLDLLQLLPHAKKEAKLDTKSERGVINEVADLKGCSSVVFFEARKHKDLYIWLTKAPHGPCVKFHATNVHTMAELKLAGNHLRGSRPVLSFDAAFDAEPHLQLLKEVFTQAFATPRRHPRAKPFFDHVISFSASDGRVWLRNYQVVADPEKKKAARDVGDAGVALVEVGPRACLNPIKMLAGSFGGPVIYDNPTYVSPNAVRAALRRRAQGKYAGKVAQREGRKAHLAANPAPRDPLADVFRSG
jgi:ribosome biogenesis protein BRX1